MHSLNTTNPQLIKAQKHRNNAKFGGIRATIEYYNNSRIISVSAKYSYNFKELIECSHTVPIDLAAALVLVNWMLHFNPLITEIK